MNNSSILISVIIPIYGVERYIERCVRSLFEQTLREDIEFIFVNDCTPDRSIEILKKVLEEYPHRQSQCQIVHHKTNLGLPTARKSGLNIAKGRYIAHCDSDDWVEKDAYKLIAQEAILYNPDMIECNYYISDGQNTTSSSSKYIKNSILNIFNINGHQFKYIGPYVWNKIVKREIYQQGIVFPTANISEDVVFTIQLSLLCNSYRNIEIPVYYYFVNNESLTRLARNKEDIIKRCLSFKQNVDLIVNILHKKNLINSYNTGILSIKLLVRNELLPFINDEDIYIMWNQTYPELTFYNVIFSGVPIRKKILYIMIRLRLYSLLKKSKTNNIMS